MISGEAWRIGDVVIRFRGAFRSAGFESPDREARLLVEAVAGVSIARQIAHPEWVCDPAALASLNAALEKRLAHVPLQQITGLCLFDGLSLMVDQNTLIPRPETELLVEEAFRLISERQDQKRADGFALLDTFTGSGAVGIALASRCLASGIRSRLTLTDCSSRALSVAERNAAACLPESVWTVVCADIWPSDGNLYDVITANPPYIESGEIQNLMPEVSCCEPRLALDGGADGLRFYRRLAAEGRSFLLPGGALLLEAGAGQSDAISRIFCSAGWRPLGKAADFAGWVRVLAFAG